MDCFEIMTPVTYYTDLKQDNNTHRKKKRSHFIMRRFQLVYGSIN